MTRRQRKQRKAARLTGLANLCRKLANNHARCAATYPDYKDKVVRGWYLAEVSNWTKQSARWLEERDRNG